MLCIVIVAFVSVVGVDAADLPPAVPLWTKGAPGSEGITEPEVYDPPTDRMPRGHLAPIHQPGVLVYLPPTETATRTAVVILPGGGHTTLTIDHEGRDIAAWFNQIGVAAFVLKYRLARTRGHDYTIDTSIGDTSRAIRLVRSRAAEWNIAPDRIGLVAFSAGGAVGAYAGMRFDVGDPAAEDPVERVSSRPDFEVLAYPGRMEMDYTVPSDAPPVFLVSAYDDDYPARNVARLFLAFKEAGVSAELHVYAHGGHGFALVPTHHPVDAWNDRLREWMSDISVLPTR